jgi:hypothetical protein
MVRMHWMKSASLALILISANPLFAESGYHLLKKIPVPGDKGWDYLRLDSKTRRLYLTHGDRLQILDVDSDTMVGEVDDLKGIHGVALAPDLNRAYISDGQANAAVCFDLNHFKVVDRIPTQGKPDAIVYDPLTARVFAMNGESGSATVIQAGDNAVLGNIDLGGQPEFAAVDGEGNAFVNLEDKSELVKLNTKTMKLSGRFSIAPGQSPSSLSIDVKNHRLFIGCRNQLMIVMNSDTGGVLASISIGAGVDASCFDPELGLIFHSCGDGTLSVVHQDDPDHYSIVENAVTQHGSRTMALDLKTHHVFLSSAEFGPLPTPEAGHETEHRRPPIIAGSFAILEFGRE